MSFIAEAFFGGCISKVINDGKDYSWAKIKSVTNDKNDRNLSTRIYRIIEKVLIKVTDKKFKGTDILYEAIEKIFIEFRDNGSTIESVKCGLGMLKSDTSDQRCENFLEKFYGGIRHDDDLYKAVNMILQQNGIKISQEEFQQLNEKIDNLTEIVSRENDNKIDIQKREPVKSRTQEYADKWNANMFLNDFDEWDENAGVNVKLSDVYINEHLPHFKHGQQEKEFDNLDVLLSKYITKSNDNKMLLVLGQPGIGKSTLITWITVNFADRINDILVYKFASDLGNTDWSDGRISNRVLEELGFNHSDLNAKILILDGFDEVSIEANRRKDILDSLYGDWIYNKTIDNFSLIITCRENYIQEFEKLKCKFITLRPWNEVQIQSFFNIFQKKTKNNLSENTIEKLFENKEILGIPLILYMVLALNISIEKEGSIVDVYDKIFSLESGIYDRCIDNKNYADKHRIGVIKKQIHQISREIAIWMFENNSEETYISKEEYQKICDNVMQRQGQDNGNIKQDFLIGNFFKLVKYCEGIETEELYFVHRSIYEYFVAETIYSSIENAMTHLSEGSQEELARNIAVYLKQGEIDYPIGEYLKYKILKLYNKLSAEKQGQFYHWWEKSIEKMMKMGMFYYTQKTTNYINIFAKETQCFKNVIEILRLLFSINKNHYIFEDVDQVLFIRYIKHSLVECRILYLDDMEIDNTEQVCEGYVLDLSKLNFAKVNLEMCNLSAIDLSEVNLKYSTLSQANLKRANLKKANLEGADLEGADLSGADLSGANLTDIKLENTKLKETIFSDKQVDRLWSKYDLQDIYVYVTRTADVVDYKKYCYEIV